MPKQHYVYVKCTFIPMCVCACTCVSMCTCMQTHIFSDCKFLFPVCFRSLRSFLTPVQLLLHINLMLCQVLEGC